MSKTDPQKEWERYKEKELGILVPLLSEMGYVLDESQPHMGGERYVMQAVTTTSGRKLILLGRREEDDLKVVIKATSDPAGARELEHELLCREMLKKIHFAYSTFESPKMLTEFRKGALRVTIQEFIDQEQTFLERPLQEQFAIALRAFKAQEGAHATTHGHFVRIKRVFESYDAERYLLTYDSFKEYARAHDCSTHTLDILNSAREVLHTHKNTIDQYCGFLTHTDFVPHNIRIKNDTIYLLDHSSIRFGNKHEGWARFLNFMTLYSPELEVAMLKYTEDNKAPEEQTSLKMMRLYRLGELVRYYVQATSLSDNTLQRLNAARIEFWTNVLDAVMNDTPLSAAVRTRYMATRDTLRSDDEKRRQIGLH